MIQPSPMASVMEPASAGFASSSQRRGVTPLVLLLKRSGNISARSLTVVVRSSVGVDGGHAVGAVRADDGEVRHADFRSPPSSTRLTRSTRPLVSGEAGPHLVEQAPVDLQDDLEMPRQQQLEPRQWPLLQRLGQERVIRVGEGPSGEIPGLVPAEVRLVEQDSQELGDGERRVGVVELDRDLPGKLVPVRIRAAEPPHEIRQRARHQEVLLHEAQPCPMVVESSGYSTRVRDSAASRSASALTNSPLLNAWKSNDSGAAAAHSRSVLIVLPP